MLTAVKEPKVTRELAERSTGCSGLLALVLLFIAPVAKAEGLRPWMVSGAGGLAAIHETSRTGPFLGIQVHRILWGDRLRLDAGALVAAADEGFGDLGVGIEFRLCSEPCTAAGYIGVGAGVLSEPEFGGGSFRLDGGLEVRLSERNVLRLGVQGGTHGGRSGPHLISVAFGRRFGGPR
jgi:hypothetical protein